MFTDRWWFAKLAAALLLFAALSSVSGNLIEDLHPIAERTALSWDEVKDKTILVLGKKVESADAEGFTYQSAVGPLRVLTPTPPPVGEFVSAVTRPVGPRTLRASFVQINAGWAWKRPLNYAISILVLLAYLFHHRRLFRWPAAGGVLRGRY